MRFLISSGDLLRALNVVNGAVPNKSTIPILECVLFERLNGQLRLSATDLEISIIQEIDVNFETNGVMNAERVAVPAKRLIETLRNLPDLPLTFAATTGYNIELTTDQGKYKMVGFDGLDYPALPHVANGLTITADGSMLKRTFAKTGFAVSKDSLRPAMMGVYFKLNPTQGEAVATDGHRLVRMRTDALKSPEDTTFIVPEKALSISAKVANDGPCTIYISDGYLGFDFGGTHLISRVIDERFPNYEAVIPKDNSKQVVINRLALLAAVRRVGLYSSSLTHQIRLSLTQDKLRVSAEDIERASEAEENILCEYSDEAFEIGFNSVYLMETLNNMDTSDVLLNFSTPNRAGIVTPNEQTEGEDLMMLIMPVMLNSYA